MSHKSVGMIGKISENIRTTCKFLRGKKQREKSSKKLETTTMHNLEKYKKHN